MTDMTLEQLKEDILSLGMTAQRAEWLDAIDAAIALNDALKAQLEHANSMHQAAFDFLADVARVNSLIEKSGRNAWWLNPERMR